MGDKISIVVGAGSTLSDGISKPLKRRPPLDRGFFKNCGELGIMDEIAIAGYLRRNYDIDPTMREHDSLERIMAIVYADINNPRLEKSATNAFRSIIRLFNRRIAETTNELKSTNRTNLYRIIAKLFNEGVSPSDITILTFNQDIQIEKVLKRLQETKAYNKLGKIFCFPTCYSFPNVHDRLSSPPKGFDQFDICDEKEKGIRILKLHGSLNWFSTHTSKRVPKQAILNSKKEFHITPRTELPVNMSLQREKRTVHTFPLIIPPVNHKAAIIHKDLNPIWGTAEKCLRESQEIIVFGYSCPSTDFESANLIRRTASSGANPSSFTVIDPNPEVFQRYVDVTNLDHLSYFRNADAYIQKG